MLGSIPTDTFYTAGFQLLDICLCTIGNLRVFRVYIRISRAATYLVVGNGVTVTIVDITVPAQAVVAVPPRVMV